MLIADARDGNLLRRVNETTTTKILGFESPSSVVSDSFGNLFIVDSSDDCVFWLDASGTLRTMAARPANAGFVNGIGLEARFSLPRMIVFDSKGRLFLTDQANKAIRMITWT